MPRVIRQVGTARRQPVRRGRAFFPGFPGFPGFRPGCSPDAVGGWFPVEEAPAPEESRGAQLCGSSLMSVGAPETWSVLP
ncbi:hypothetical protein GCM10010284_39780 [Streptomyces rubiginosohelvolus]|nr:hypothetical protein GCM10010284_39780 [Streptomyces rubiginosohelvolus]